MKRSVPSQVAVVAEACAAQPALSALSRRNLLWSGVILSLATLLLTRSVHAEGGDKRAAREYQERLKQQRQEAERRDVDTSRMNADQLQRYKQQEQARKDKLEKKQDLAEFKEKTMTNLGSIKELFMKAEAAWKEKQYAAAGPIYASVSLATVPGGEQMAETSRNRLLEMEELAKKQLNEAEDADRRQDYVKEVEILSVLTHDFSRTKAREMAERNLIALKSRPDVAGYVDLAAAEALETGGKLSEAVALYNNIATNPRYENTLPSLKASRRLDELQKDESIVAKLSQEANAKADKEAPVLLAMAKNFVANNRPRQAIEKLQAIVDRFPDSQYAGDARKQIGALKEMIDATK